MGYIVLMVLLGLVVAALLFSKRILPVEVARYSNTVSMVVGALMALITLVASVNQVPAGHVGIVYKFGAIEGQIDEGLQFVSPWRSVRLANTQVQTHPFNKLATFSEESQDVFVDATLNVRVSPKTVQALYRNVGANWFEVLVSPRVAQNFKDETVKYKSVAIAPNREKIRHNVTERLKLELAPYSIEVTDLLLNNVDFDPKFKAAINDKQIATQKALEEEQIVQVARFKADQAVETAKGKGQASYEEAIRTAKGNSALAASLTPELTRWTMVQKLSDKIQVIMMPAGQNFILDSSVLGVKKEKSKE